jgi:hypothetical protein
MLEMTKSGKIAVIAFFVLLSVSLTIIYMSTSGIEHEPAIPNGKPADKVLIVTVLSDSNNATLYAQSMNSQPVHLTQAILKNSHSDQIEEISINTNVTYELTSVYLEYNEPLSPATYTITLMSDNGWHFVSPSFTIKGN